MPWLRTVALRVKEAPGAGLLSVTEGAPTTKSGVLRRRLTTVTGTALEQLLPVLVSPETATTQAP